MNTLRDALERSASVDLDLVVDGAVLRFAQAWSEAVVTSPSQEPVVLKNDYASVRMILSSIAHDAPLISHQAGNTESTYPSGPGLTQQSSGTTGAPKSVFVCWQSLLTVVERSVERMGPFVPPVRVLSWLPLSHDLGLIGMLICPLVGIGLDQHRSGRVEVIRPESFLLHPPNWLKRCANERISMSAVTPSAIRVLRKHGCTISPERFSSLESVIVGGEFVDVDDLTWLEGQLHDSKVRQNVSKLRPAYGCAEAGLTLAMTERATIWRTRTVSCSGLAAGSLASGAKGDSIEIVGCGPPLTPSDLRIGGTVGNIEFRDSADAPWTDTGDLGFIDEGELFVAGRVGDYLNPYNGRVFFAPRVDRLIQDSLASVRAVVCAELDDTGRIGILVACRGLSNASNIAEAVALRFREIVGCSAYAIAVGHRRAVPMTPSGKVQRRAAAALLVSLCDGEVVSGLALVSVRQDSA